MLLQGAAGGGKPAWARTRPEVPGADGRCHHPTPPTPRSIQGLAGGNTEAGIS